MYTDYDAAKYLLQNSHAMPRCIEITGENAPLITRGPAETSQMQLATNGTSGSAENSLTPNPKTPAKHGDIQ